MSAQAAFPSGLIDAQVPPERRGIPRDGVRMLITNRQAGTHLHARFFDLPKFLNPGDLLVVNDSATVAAALRVRRSSGESLPLHVSTQIDAQLWIVEPRGTVYPGEILALAEGAAATLLTPVSDDSTRLWYATFSLPLPMFAFLAKHGEPIKYGYVSQRFPLSDYQTMFARIPGSAEMPSAARPFTEPVLRAIRRAGINVAAVTLHCGVASMEAPETPSLERFEVPAKTAQAVNAARTRGARVIAVGTTVVRALESASRHGETAATSGWTALVIEPGYRLCAANAIITGFHDPTATHLAMLGAFASPDVLDDAYRTAAAAHYFKHEFGDVHAVL